MSPTEEERNFRQADINAAAVAAAAAVANEVVKMAAATASQVLAVANQNATARSEAVSLDLQYIKKDLEDIKGQLQSRFVSTEAFEPVKRLVYGFTTLVLTAVIVAILVVVIKQ